MFEDDEVGTCDWCSYPVYEDDDYIEGNGGNGVMHRECDPVEREVRAIDAAMETLRWQD
jgi:hypothetical protein